MNALFAAFERPRDARVVALFRIAFFAGIALHFFPSLLHVEESYGAEGVRLQAWSSALHAHANVVPLKAAALLTMSACLSALLGFFPRASACLVFAGTYLFASLNALPVQTLALVNAWAILPAFCVCRGAAGAWSIDAWRLGPQRTVPGMLGSLVVWQVALAFFFAGIEKLLAGWAVDDEMARLFATPRGYMLRNWAWDIEALRHPAATAFFSWFTVVVEVGATACLAWRRTRLLGFLLLEVLLLAIVAMIQVPPLFFTTFSFGLLLVFRSKDLERYRATQFLLRRDVILP